MSCGPIGYEGEICVMMKLMMKIEKPYLTLLAFSSLGGKVRRTAL